MKKTILTVASLLSLLIAPLSASAAINTINGQNGTAQTLATTSAATTTMHMKIGSSGNTHTFQWDNTAWAVGQGGTGWTAFTSGALIYGNGTGALATTTAGTLGYVLQYNGTFPTWVSTSSLGIVAGSDKEIQFNDNGTLAGESRITWDKAVQTLTLDGRLDVGYVDLTAGPLGLKDNQGIEWTSGAPGSGGRMSIYNADALNTLSIYKAVPHAGWGLGLDLENLTDLRFVTFPDQSGRVSLLEANQTWTGANTFSQGAVGTTTVNFGTMGSTTSHTCFNTKNTDGDDISFFFVGTSMVVEANACQ